MVADEKDINVEVGGFEEFLLAGLFTIAGEEETYLLDFCSGIIRMGVASRPATL